jgi:subtilisin family serine protease
VLLGGDPNSPAIEAVRDFDSGDRISDAEISEASNGVRVVRTKIEIEFSTDATVGEVNALLKSNEGLITSMLERLNFIVVRIPDPESLEALDSRVAQLESDPTVVRVYYARIPVPNELPGNYTADGSPLPRIDHQLAVRAHAAWNAKAALKGEFAAPPLLIVQDLFGGGTPNGDFDVKTVGHFGTSKPNAHGYHVLGIIAARHGGEPSDRGQATGIYPGTLDLLAFDHTWLDDVTIENLIIFQAKNSKRNIVVNSSTGNDLTCDETLAECLVPLARKWIKKVRGFALYETGKTGPASLENKFLLLSAAGNIDDAFVHSDAALDSSYNAARLMTDLDTEKGVKLDNLNNTLVIEDRENGSSQPYEAECLSDGSMRGGDLSAIGTDVWSLTGASTGAENFSGTSMSTPQAAGLAAYVWALAPGLSSQELLSLLTQTARDDVCSGGGAQAKPVIDAYNAVLAVDHASALSGGGTPEAPVRLAILDVVDAKGEPGGDGAFDERDIEEFMQEYSAREGAIDYSRYDLNGDGWTDGLCDRTEKFNLDIDYPPSYGNVTQDIKGKAVAFDEEKATDMHVLCYYAYSPLYMGDTSLRDSIVGSRCSECDGDDPPPPWPVPPEIDGRGDNVGATVELRSGLTTYYDKNCFTSQTKFPQGSTASLVTGCITYTYDDGSTDETTNEDIEPYYLGPFGASWSVSGASEHVDSTGSAQASSQTSVELTENELIMKGSLTASATATSTQDDSGQGFADASARHFVNFKVPAALYELTWDCDLSHVQLSSGSTFIVREGVEAPTWKVENCEGASGSLAGEYWFEVRARGQSVSQGGSDPKPQTRGGSFQLVLKPPPPQNP